jgi:hypothetical protein
VAAAVAAVAVAAEAVDRVWRMRRAGTRNCCRRQGLTDNACYVILHIVEPRFLSQMDSHDVASNVFQALVGGARVGRRARG